MTSDVPKVRPLRDEEAGGKPGNLPRLWLVLSLVVGGALIGWGFAALGGDGTTAQPESPDTAQALSAADNGAGTSSVSWVQATQVPAFPDGYHYAGATDPIEYENSLFLAVRFVDPATSAVRTELWSSTDGLAWESEPIELGEPVAVLDLVATDTGIILAGSGESYALWRSLPGQPIDGSSWSRLDIEVPSGFEVKCHATVVNDQGAVATVAVGNLEIWRDAVAPFVPDNVDPYDPCVLLAGNSLYFPEQRASIPLFAETPEVVTTADSIWVRVVTLDGEEIIHSYSLPAGSHLVETAPDLGYLRVGLAWYSRDGVDFLPVVDESALPDGYFLPRAWFDGFITAAYEMVNSSTPFEDVTLWDTVSGSTWEPVATQPPVDCGRYLMSSGAGRLLLTGSDGTRCVGTPDGSWKVLDERSGVTYTVGGPAGFVGYPQDFDYGTALFSPDGERWSQIDIPAPEPYPTLVVLEHRLFALSANQADPTLPKHIDIWIGDIY